MLAPTSRMLAPTLQEFRGAGDVGDLTSTETLITPIGRAFQLHIPPFPQQVVYCHRVKAELLVYLGCTRSKSDGNGSEECTLKLERRLCSHFTAGSPKNARGRVWTTESGIDERSAYRAVQTAGTVFVHSDLYQASECMRMERSAGSSRALRISSDAFDPELAREDAQRFGIS